MMGANSALPRPVARKFYLLPMATPSMLILLMWVVSVLAGGGPPDEVLVDPTKERWVHFYQQICSTNNTKLGRGKDGAAELFATIGGMDGGPWACAEDGCPDSTVDCSTWADEEPYNVCFRPMREFWKGTLPVSLGNGSSLLLEHCGELCHPTVLPCVTLPSGVCEAAGQHDAAINATGAPCGEIDEDGRPAHGARCMPRPGANGDELTCVRGIARGTCESSTARRPPSM